MLRIILSLGLVFCLSVTSAVAEVTIVQNDSDAVIQVPIPFAEPMMGDDKATNVSVDSEQTEIVSDDFSPENFQFADEEVVLDLSEKKLFVTKDEANSKEYTINPIISQRNTYQKNSIKNSEEVKITSANKNYFHNNRVNLNIGIGKVNYTNNVPSEIDN